MNRITADQSNANNVLIDNINDGFDDCLNDYCTLCNDVLGTSYSIKVRQPKVESIHSDNYEEEVDEDGDR